jgi:hypothetical protein
MNPYHSLSFNHPKKFPPSKTKEILIFTTVYTRVRLRADLNLTLF